MGNIYAWHHGESFVPTPPKRGRGRPGALLSTGGSSFPSAAFGQPEVIQFPGVPSSQSGVLATSRVARSLSPVHSSPIVPNTWKSLPRGIAPARGPRTRFFDPLALVYATGFRDRRFALTYDVLRRVSYQLSFVNAIIQTRVMQVAAFARPYRENKQIGFAVRFKNEEHVPTESERKYILEIEEFIMNCGWGPKIQPHSPFPREPFGVFLRKVVRDSLTYDQMCAEIVPDTRGRPYEFRAVDAATMRLAATYDGYRGQEPQKFRARDFTDKFKTNNWGNHWKKEYGENFELDGEGVFAVQLLHGRIENIFTYHDMAFCIRNNRSDVWVNGYGFAEIEMCLNTVLRMLWAEEYNARVFRQGSLANGILNFKGDQFDPKEIEAFRRVWQADVAGVENCLVGDTQIWTQEEGAATIQDTLGELEERKVRIWTGTEWADGLVYRTSKPKKRCKTRLGNGVEIETSPDHRFLVIGDDGEPVWRTQENLVEGDFVFVNKQEIATDEILPQYKDKKITPELMEVLGWSKSNYSNRIASQAALKYLRLAREKHRKTKCFSHRELQDISAIRRGDDGCSLTRLLSFLQKAQVEIPEWMTSFYFEPVVALERTEEFIPMFDVSVETEEHRFVANGIVTHNSHKVPVIQVPEGVEFVNMQHGNKEMEYNNWLNYLMKIVSGTYQIDPSEINFDLVSGSGGGSGPLFESKHEWKIKHSKDKGLRPLLQWLAEQMNEYVINPLDPNLYFDFVGLDQLSENDRIDLLTKKVSNFMTINEGRQEEGLAPIPGGNIVNNPTFLQAYQAEQQTAKDAADQIAPWATAGDAPPEQYGKVTPIPLYLQEAPADDTGGQEGAEGMMPGGAPPPGMPGLPGM